uniref:Uncharacterized protein n=1 Tax=Angiostrongylus cantonensis TaxID=6313 RepID=A0A0K0D9R7_ANGCA
MHWRRYRPGTQYEFKSNFRSAPSGKPTFIRFGKRTQPNFIRFGRAQPSFIRFGKKDATF